MQRKHFLFPLLALFLFASLPAFAADPIEGTYVYNNPSENFTGTVKIRKKGNSFSVEVSTAAGRYSCSFDGTGKKGASDVVNFSGDGFTLPIRFSDNGLTMVGDETDGPLAELRRYSCGMNGVLHTGTLYKKTKGGK